MRGGVLAGEAHVPGDVCGSMHTACDGSAQVTAFQETLNLNLSWCGAVAAVLCPAGIHGL